MFSNEWFSHLEIANKAINQDQIVALGVRQDMTPSPLFLYLRVPLQRGRRVSQL